MIDSVLVTLMWLSIVISGIFVANIISERLYLESTAISIENNLININKYNVNDSPEEYFNMVVQQMSAYCYKLLKDKNIEFGFIAQSLSDKNVSLIRGTIADKYASSLKLKISRYTENIDSQGTMYIRKLEDSTSKIVVVGRDIVISLVLSRKIKIFSNNFNIVPSEIVSFHNFWLS